jgi:tetratricopeptide (TPR) repeat protein
VRVGLFVVGAVAAVLVCLAGCGDPLEGTDARELLNAGWRAYSMGDWDVAQRSFRTVERLGAATEAERSSALLGLATTAHYRQPTPDLKAAEDYYQQVLDEGTPEAERLAMLGLAHARRLQGNRQGSLAVLQQIRQLGPDTTEADESVLHTVEILFEPVPVEGEAGHFDLPTEDDQRAGQALLEQWLQRRPDNVLASTMHRLLASRHLEAGDYAAAVRELQAALAKGVTSARTISGILWQIARLAERELKDYALAEQYYEKFVEVSRRNVLYYRARLSLDRVRQLSEQQGE